MSSAASSIKVLIGTNEKIFVHDGFEIPYLLIKDDEFQDHLVVVFSAFNSDQAENAYSYNFIRTLTEYKGNKLFILDCIGPRGSYYLGKAPEYGFSRAVRSLIESTRSDLELPPERVLCVGSSKGGAAALYHGVSGGYGGVISGAPQTRIASYVEKCSLPTYEFMFEGDPNRIQSGNDVIVDACRKRIGTRVWLVTSPLDWQYGEHVEPFLREVGANFDDLRIIVPFRIRGHQDIAAYFKEHLPQLVTDFVIGISKRVFEIDFHDYLKVYSASDSELYDPGTRTLRVPANRVMYLQTFDGSFDAPPKEETFIRLSRIPPHCRKMIIRIALSVTCPLNLVIFAIQYLQASDGKTVKSNKVVQCEKGRHVLDMPIKLQPGAQFAKVALRFKSDVDCETTIDSVSARYFD